MKTRSFPSNPVTDDTVQSRSPEGTLDVKDPDVKDPGVDVSHKVKTSRHS